MKRKTHKTRRRTRPKVLEVRVMSPRIAWHGFTRILSGLLRIALLLAVIGGIGWGIWRGIEHTFHHNPDFRLQVIDLNENPVLDEADLIEITGIDLPVNTSLFEVDITETRERLEAMPAVLEAIVERHLPGTLSVRITSRKPRAWVAQTDNRDLSGLRQAGGLLLDHNAHVYPCPELQLDTAAKLPIILLDEDQEHPLKPNQKLEHPALYLCFKLLDSAEKADPQSLQWIDSIHQLNEWSLQLITREGTSATFGLRDHPAQMDKLRAALNHAGQKGYTIDTINLIPRFNVPITVQGNRPPPRAVPVYGNHPSNH